MALTTQGNDPEQLVRCWKALSTVTGLGNKGIINKEEGGSEQSHEKQRGG